MAKKQKSSPVRALKIVILVVVLAGVLAYIGPWLTATIGVFNSSLILAVLIVAYFGPWLTETIGVFNSSLILAVLIVAYFQSETDDLSARLEYLEKKLLGASGKEPR